jgi:hypothetical protein
MSDSETNKYQLFDLQPARVKQLVERLNDHQLTIMDGLPVTFDFKHGYFSAYVECTKTQLDLIRFHQTAKRKAKENRADAIKAAQVALKEAKSRDYGEEAMKRNREKQVLSFQKR